MSSSPRAHSGVPSEPRIGLCTVIEDQLLALAEAADLSCEVRETALGVFHLLTSESLGRPVRPPFDGLSHINENGLPFQWAVTSGAPGVRFICESGVPGTASQARAELTLDRLGEVARLLGRPRPDWFDGLARAVWLPRPDQWPSHWESALWTGVSADPSGVNVKSYVNLNWGGASERWRRIGWTLHRLGRMSALEAVCDLSAAVSPGSWPVAMAVDIGPDGEPGRLKAYFRCGPVGESWLARWYEALGAFEPAAMLRQLLDSFPRTAQDFPERSVVIGLEIHPDQSLSLKADLAVALWTDSADDIDSGVRQAFARLALDRAQLEGAQEALGVRDAADTVRWLSLGYEPNMSTHLNVYLEPPLPRVTKSRRVRRLPARDPVTAGVDYLLDARTGLHWEDFPPLPVGAADVWPTAWVLFHLAAVADVRRDALRSALAGAAAWLRTTANPDGGWGYNSTTASDRDSTALVKLALQRVDSMAGRGPDSHLMVPLNRDGGVATYGQAGGDWGTWQCSSPEITAISAGAFWEGHPPNALIDYLRASRQRDGLWPAFWWLTPMYATWAVLTWAPGAAADRLPATRLAVANYVPVGSFETALTALSRKAAGLDAGPLIADLRQRQRSDGSWSPGAWWRVVQQSIAEPWRSLDAGPAYVDERAVLTTTLAVAALADEVPRRL